jgi:membrane protein implicated in regulation of membrane protease activity
VSDVAWAAWLAAAVVLVLLEMSTVHLHFAMLALAALVAAAVAPAAPVGVQLSAALAAALVGLLVIRPFALRHLQSGPQLISGTAALVGRPAHVLARVDRGGGQVKLAGEVWSARSADEASVYEPGQDVSVIRIDGATALVG